MKGEIEQVALLAVFVASEKHYNRQYQRLGNAIQLQLALNIRDRLIGRAMSMENLENYDQQLINLILVAVENRAIVERELKSFGPLDVLRARVTRLSQETSDNMQALIYGVLPRANVKSELGITDEWTIMERLMYLGQVPLSQNHPSWVCCQTSINQIMIRELSKQCRFCGATNPRKLCKDCRCVRYCSEECKFKDDADPLLAHITMECDILRSFHGQ